MGSGAGMGLLDGGIGVQLYRRNEGGCEGGQFRV